jgi:transposase InsO family protein
MGHLSFRKMNHLVHNGLVEGVKVKSFQINDDCVACKQGKQSKKPHKSKTVNSIIKPLELLHMDLFGPVQYLSISGNAYCFVVTDDFSRFTWVMFLRHKSETFKKFTELVPLLETKYTLKVRAIRTDNGGEFCSKQMEDYCVERGIHHQTTAPYTPQNEWCG